MVIETILNHVKTDNENRNCKCSNVNVNSLIPIRIAMLSKSVIVENELLSYHKKTTLT